jgi:hypothetical protein
MNVSSDDIPEDVNNRVPLEFNRVPDGKRMFGVDETFFLNVIDIVEKEEYVCVHVVMDGCLFLNQSSFDF